MPTYVVTDSVTGKKLRLTGDSAPTEQELEQIFSQYRPQSTDPDMQKIADNMVAPRNEFMRQMGLTGRHIAEGLAQVGGIVANPINYVADKALEAVGSDYRVGHDLRGAVASGLDKAGVPIPGTPTERVVGDASRAVAGAAGTMGVGGALTKVASPVAAAVGDVLSSSAGMQGVSAATGGASAGTAREMGAGPVGQAVAGIAGSVAPGVISTVVPNATRALYRGGEQGRQTVQQNIDDFAAAGTTPTVGQATQGRISRAVETLLSRTPGSAGRIARKAVNQADDLSRNLDDMANSLSANADPTRAGLSISRGVSGKGGFVETFQRRADQLYSRARSLVPDDQPVDLSQTQKVLRELTDPVPGAQRTSQALINPALAKIREALDDDVANAFNQIGQGALPNGTVSALRSQIGRRLANSGLVDDIPTGELKRIYGALSDDLEAAAAKVGPDAVNAVRRATNYYRAGLNRIELLESVINKNGGPEKIFDAVLSGSKEGATIINRVMRSVPQQSRRDVAAAVLRRMGRATAGQQNAEGDAFSIGTFLTNWNKISPEARAVLFNRFGDKFSKEISSIARVASNLREGSRVFSNPSGTGQAVVQGSTVGGAAMAAILGRLDVAGGILAGMGGANIMARAMTNPKFVNWLASTSRLPESNIAAHIGVLSGIARDSGDVDLLLLSEALNEPQQNGNQQGNGNGNDR